MHSWSLTGLAHPRMTHIPKGRPGGTESNPVGHSIANADMIMVMEIKILNDMLLSRAILCLLKLIS